MYKFRKPNGYVFTVSKSVDPEVYTKKGYVLVTEETPVVKKEETPVVKTESKKAVKGNSKKEVE